LKIKIPRGVIYTRWRFMGRHFCWNLKLNLKYLTRSATLSYLLTKGYTAKQNSKMRPFLSNGRILITSYKRMKIEALESRSKNAIEQEYRAKQSIQNSKKAFHLRSLNWYIFCEINTQSDTELRKEISKSVKIFINFKRLSAPLKIIYRVSKLESRQNLFLSKTRERRKVTRSCEILDCHTELWDPKQQCREDIGRDWCGLGDQSTRSRDTFLPDRRRRGESSTELWNPGKVTRRRETRSSSVGGTGRD
jgi:hypothetical protein